jgi:uncharacterized membrane protein YccC
MTNTKTNVMLYFGAIFAGLATAMISRPFLGHDWAPQFGTAVGFTFAAFAFQSGKRAWAMAVMFLLIHGGANYYRYVRQDAVGVGVAVVCVAIAVGIGWPLRRRVVLDPH